MVDRVTRLTARDIFEAATKNAEDELRRPSNSLAFSGLIGGMTMGLTGLTVAAVLARIGRSDADHFVATLFYPIGFIAVIIGRAQLFTENTLYPVLLVLKERRHLLTMGRVWGVVLTANLLGTLLFALLATKTGALHADVERELTLVGHEAGGGSFVSLFWSAIVGGWAIALVAWLVSASQHTIGQVAVIWLLTFFVGIGRFAHSIAGSAEVLVATLNNATEVHQYFLWLAAAVSGNVVGGVSIVSLLNYGQIQGGLD